MLNKKGFLLVESILFLEITLVVISVLSFLVFVIHHKVMQENQNEYKRETELVQEVYQSVKKYEE